MNCRFGPKREAPFEIPASANYDFECDLTIVAAGAIGGQVHVYYDDGGLRETVLTVSGEAAERPR